MRFTVTQKKPVPHATTERLAVSRKEAAGMLSVSEKTLMVWGQEGRVKEVRIGGRVLYPLDALRQLIDDSAVK